ncbi:MAG: lipopolysaccharide heptosyltransferase II, partial [Gammaproteobacteria bacterium]
MKILVVFPNWLGDAIMAHGFVQALVQNYASKIQSIHALAPAYLRDILNHMSEIQKSFESPVAHGKLNLSGILKSSQALKQEQYSHAYVLPNSWKSALIPFLAKIPKRIGWLGECRIGLLNDWRSLNQTKYPSMLSRFIALAYEKGRLNFPLPYPKLLVNTEHRLLKSDQPALAICPGAEFGPAKQWPARHFAKVAQHFLNRGYEVLILGNQKDAAIADNIQYLAPKIRNLAGKTTLEQALIKLTQVQLVLSNDSGLMHLAAALQKPLVAIYGSTNSEFTPPFLPA